MKLNSYLWNIIINLFVVLLSDKLADAFKPYASKVTRCTRGGWPRGDGRRSTINSISKQYMFPSTFPKRRNLVSIQMRGWDSDDIRFTSRLRRKLARRRLLYDSSTRSLAKTTLIALQIILYCFQILTTIAAIRAKFPSSWPDQAPEIIVDSIWGSAIANGPLTNKFGFSAAFSKANNPYRYITSGLFHNGLLHLLFNIGMMSWQPSWLATGLGSPLYLTTFFLSIITGNIAHVMNSPDRLFDIQMYLGSSAGICGLYGLMFVCLTRMSNVNPGNNGASPGQLLRGIALMIFLGMLIENVNTAINIGGFFGGIIIGTICGPSYEKDYAMRKKFSTAYDPVNKDYRSTMGFGIMPTKGGLIPLKVLYSILLIAVLSIPTYRNALLAIPNK